MSVRRLPLASSLYSGFSTWADASSGLTVSDYIGRKNTYYIFFVLGAILYYLAPRTGVSRMNSIPLFVAIVCVIVSMYGGGFATVPAYLRGLFDTMEVGAIPGRLLTAWSAAGIFGPVLANYIREYLKKRGSSGGHVLDRPLRDARMVGRGSHRQPVGASVNPKHWYQAEATKPEAAAAGLATAAQ